MVRGRVSRWCAGGAARGTRPNGGRPPTLWSVTPAHSYERSFWGRRIALTLLLLVALALAGYVGSVVGPHFKGNGGSSAPPTTARDATTTTTSVVPAKVSVVVANGTQEPNAAAHFTQQLQEKGWNLSTPRNTTAAASATAIYYAPSHEAAAAEVASQLDVAATSVQPLTASVPVANASLFDVVVVIGPDLAGSGFPTTTTTVPTT